ncbi:MAG TPA: ABC transporter ATP-binding protein [Candidatus Acidoferrum sp.]|jgi:ABC-2 type transport system ATP-binding protein|nr:ABC transporter ATP-binding protein [Candidatus Acidoferrum sp.]
MNSSTPAIDIQNLAYSYGKAEAVHDLSLRALPGRCYGLFGRNGAGKTTAMKCLLNLLRPQRGQVRVFGLDPANVEVEVKRRLAYVPDQLAFYPWMTVRETLDYLASFRERWNKKTEQELLERFRLDSAKRTAALSKGQRTQLALIAAICPETDLLVLDEPTSGLDPIVRREFIETVIGAYQEGGSGERTILVSTHLITEFEGLIDEFTIIDQGRAVLTLEADEARHRFQKIRARFAQPLPELDLQSALRVRREGREIELIVNGSGPQLLERLSLHQPEALTAEALTLEEVFVAVLKE